MKKGTLFSIIGFGFGTYYGITKNKESGGSKVLKSYNTVQEYVDSLAPEYLTVNDSSLNFSLRLDESGKCMYMKNRTNKELFVTNVILKHPYACGYECRGFADLVRNARIPGDTTVLALPLGFKPNEEKKIIEVNENNKYEHKLRKYMSAGIKFE